MEEVLDLMPESFSQRELEDLAALNPELQHLHIMVLSPQDEPPSLSPGSSYSTSNNSGSSSSSSSSNGTNGLDPTSSSSLSSSSSPSPSSSCGLDFTKVSFRSLRSLSLEGVNLSGLRLTADNAPLLESLSIGNPPGAPLAFFELALPELRRLSLEGVALSPPGPGGQGGDGFAPSLLQCPKLESFAGYRLLGLGGFHFLSLRRCAGFSLLFCDDVKGLDLDAPRLASLDCQACPSLVRLRLHDHHRAPLATPDAVRAFRAEANRVDEGRSGAAPAAEEEAERDRVVDALVERLWAQEQERARQREQGKGRRDGQQQGQQSQQQVKALGPAAVAAADGDGAWDAGQQATAAAAALAAAATTNPQPPSQPLPPLTVNLLNTHLGPLSLQRLAARQAVSLEGVTTQLGALGLSPLLPVDSPTDGDLNAVDGATSCGCYTNTSNTSNTSAGGSPGTGTGTGAGMMSPRSLDSPCSCSCSCSSPSSASSSGGGFAPALPE